MKEKNLYFLIFGLLILFYPVLTKAFQKSDAAVIKVECISTISEDNSFSHDIGVLDLAEGNSEFQIRIVREEISVPIKTLSCSKFINIYFINKNIKNQTGFPATREFISNYHCSIFFTGVLLI